LALVGKTIVSDKFPITMDNFWFAIASKVIINPFDFVTVKNLYNTKTIGFVKELQSVVLPENVIDSTHLSTNTVAKVAVMGNTGVRTGGTKSSIAISMPVGAEKYVKFASPAEIIFALGIPEMKNPIPAGIIQTTDGLQVPITLDLSYIVGPDTVHVNASGISGNQKTSYLLFLLQSAYQKVKDKNVAVIIFNTKEAELLQIHAKQEKEKERTQQLFRILDLEVKPFTNVTYFLPRGRNGKPNSAFIPEKYKTYSYELKDTYDRLDLLFPDIYDPRYDLSSILDYVYDAWPIKDNSGNEIASWTDLYKYKKYPRSIVSHKSSLLHFRGSLQRFRKSSLFVDKKVTSIYLGKAIKQIKPGDVFVIDVGTISSLDEQSFIVGDVMKSIDEMYSERNDPGDSIGNVNGINNTNKTDRPKYILIFVDEINRFIPKSQNAGLMNSVSEQIMRTLIAGRTRGTILFSAQQFKSTTDYRLHENTGLHIMVKSGFSELSTDSYAMLDESTKNSIVRLNQGGLIMIHSAFRHPIKITFPQGSFRRLK
jgi:uncharacterized protein